jgi:hypothetical protein
VIQIEKKDQNKKPYQAPQLKEYGDLNVLTLGGVGLMTDNLNMGVGTKV